eukprot:15362893-Ditylum_brightwellii.AAC.1
MHFLEARVVIILCHPLPGLLPQEAPVKVKVTTTMAHCQVEITAGLYDAAPTAQCILDMMEDSKNSNLPSPNTLTYNTAIGTWTRTHCPKAPHQTMTLLHHMHYNMHSNPDHHVDHYSYNATMEW